MAGRPKMTEKQKAEAKAAREAAKAAAQAGASGKADAAEARSAGKPGASAPAAPAAAPAPSGNTDDLDREEKALFLHHMPRIKAAKDRVNSATADLRNLYKKAKAEGNFTKADFDTAFALETAEKEARERARIARALKIAKIVGSAMGNQLDLFLEPDRTPAIDRAREEGERASMEGKSAQPPYDPSTPQFKTWLEGWHGHQATLAKGIRPTNPAVKEDVAAAASQKANSDQQRAQDAQAFEADGKTPKASQPANPDANAEIPGGQPPPAAAEQKSGVPLTRAQFKAQQEQAKAAGKPN